MLVYFAVYRLYIVSLKSRSFIVFCVGASFLFELYELETQKVAWLSEPTIVKANLHRDNLSLLNRIKARLAWVLSDFFHPNFWNDKKLFSFWLSIALLYIQVEPTLLWRELYLFWSS